VNHLANELTRHEVGRQCIAESESALTHLAALLASPFPSLVAVAIQIVHTLVQDKLACPKVLRVPELLSAILGFVQRDGKPVQVVEALNVVIAICANTAPDLAPCKLLISCGVLEPVFDLLKLSGVDLRNAALIALWNLSRHPDTRAALLTMDGPVFQSPLSCVVGSALRSDDMMSQESGLGLLWYLSAHHECAPQILRV